MRKIIQRIVSLVIVLAFSLSLVSTAYAAENISSSNLPVDYSSSEKEMPKQYMKGLLQKQNRFFSTIFLVTLTLCNFIKKM